MSEASSENWWGVIYANEGQARARGDCGTKSGLYVQAALSKEQDGRNCSVRNSCPEFPQQVEQAVAESD
jgi:hypothetical protein